MVIYILIYINLSYDLLILKCKLFKVMVMFVFLLWNVFFFFLIRVIKIVLFYVFVGVWFCFCVRRLDLDWFCDFFFCVFFVFLDCLVKSLIFISEKMYKLYSSKWFFIFWMYFSLLFNNYVDIDVCDFGVKVK